MYSNTSAEAAGGLLHPPDGHDRGHHGRPRRGAVPGEDGGRGVEGEAAQRRGGGGHGEQPAAVVPAAQLPHVHLSQCPVMTWHDLT